MSNLLCVVTKPLQYINARNIIEQDFSESEKKTLLIIDQFSGSFDFYLNVKKYDILWDEVIYERSRFKVFLTFRNKINYLITNSDLGKEDYLIKYVLKPKECYVYEEGAGSYLSSGLTFQPFKKKLIYNILKLNSKYGNSKNTNGIYLYYPSLYFSDNKISINISFEKYINTNIELFLNVFNETKRVLKSISNNKLLIVLSGWNWIFKEGDIKPFKKDSDIYIKPHPHKNTLPDYCCKYNFLPDLLLPELFIIGLLSKNVRVIVMHDASSIEINLVKLQNVKFINLGNNIEVDKLLNQIKEL